MRKKKAKPPYELIQEARMPDGTIQRVYRTSHEFCDEEFSEWLNPKPRRYSPVFPHNIIEDSEPEPQEPISHKWSFRWIDENGCEIKNE